jgi:CheY-like chemotaxis protein
VSRANTRVLLVEDSYGDVVLAQRALELDGDERFELTVAGTLCDGIECLAQGFDAILLDITLPDSVGPETVTRMRAAARDLPIVVLSGAEDADVAESCLRAGADGYEQKGRFAPSELRHIVMRAIGRER